MAFKSPSTTTDSFGQNFLHTRLTHSRNHTFPPNSSRYPVHVPFHSSYIMNTCAKATQHITIIVFVFQNIQSTNWQSMRFKIPPVNSDIGWRVEFRPCEVQITDFENAAYGVFIVLLTRAILTFKLNMLVPLSKVSSPGPSSPPGPCVCFI